MKRLPADNSFWEMVLVSENRYYDFEPIHLHGFCILIFLNVMAFNEQLAKRLRASFELQPQSIRSNISEKKMFGGLAFLYGGKMTVGIVKDDLMVRVVTQKMEKTLKSKHVRPMDFTKRPMKEFIYVSQEGIATEEQLLNYIELGLEHAKQKLNSL